MKQRETDSDKLYLPQEIIQNILKRLPVESLIRFQCVCKHWKNLIKNRSFISDHLQHFSLQNPPLLFECGGSNIAFPWCLHMLDCTLQVHEIQKSTYLIHSLRNASIVGSCNGLLCLEIHRYNQYPPSLSLWNPATTAITRVPRNTIDCFDPFDECVTVFGFSPIVNDYKIVRIYEFSGQVTRVEVFSISRGSWKGIDIGNLEGVKLSAKTVTANGAIFWSGIKLGVHNIEVEEDEDDMEEGEDNVEAIVSFDVAKEVFTVIPRPHLDYGTEEKLIVYENKLAILCDIWKDGDKASDSIELWVLDEGTSWTKRYSSSHMSVRLYSMTIWRNEIFCKPYSEEDSEKGRRKVIYTMNLNSNELKRFVIPYPYGQSIHSIYNYVESLVSVENNSIEEL